MSLLKPTDLKVYHTLYSSAINEVKRYSKALGYEINEDEFSNAYIDAFFKPKEGETQSNVFAISKDGKKQNKMLQVQIYGMRNNFELNIYIN